MKIEAVVLFSSNDKRFFKPCISNLLEAGIDVRVVTYSHMWGGSEEDQEVLLECNKLFNTNPNYHQYKIEWTPGESPWYWEGLGRYLATQEVSDDSEYILYIDIDEIVEIPLMKEWLIKEDYKKYDSIKLPNYWYWREPIHQSKQNEYSTVMLRTSLAKQLGPCTQGRECYFHPFGNKILYPLEIPFIHHYSWVRTKEEMLNKVKNWGHSSDTDWIPKVEEEFSRPFNGTDFLGRYEYINVDNIFNL
jgi:hypothetical protein